MDKKHSGGYIGLIALMIVVMFIVYFAAQQYMQFAERKHKIVPAEEQIEHGGRYADTYKNPIDRAVDAKDGIENRY